MASPDSGRSETLLIVPLLRAALVAFGLGFPAAGSARNWEHWTGCRFEPSQYFDGDSFHVTHRGQNHILRLYFADAPESDMSFPERVREQAAYFGVSETQLLEGASRARQFTARFLDQPFLVITRREPARGVSRTTRFYAQVIRAGRRLDEALISAGLARATALAAPHPNAAAGRAESIRLSGLEQAAARAGRGLWRHSQPSLGRSNPVSGTLFSRLNLNRASAAEIEALPEIGPVLAGRIIRARPLRDFAALEAIPGIGPKKIARLRQLVEF